MNESDLVNLYIKRAMREVEELVKLRILNEARIEFLTEQVTQLKAELAKFEAEITEVEKEE